MPTVVHGLPQVLDDWLAQRRALGQDGRDEVWEGVLHVAPYEHARNGDLAMQLVLLLREAAAAGGLRAGGSFNLGDGPLDYRIPDLGYHRTGERRLYMPTAALVVEVLSPDDESYAKLDFYAAHEVDEVWVLDPLERTAQMLVRHGGSYERAEVSVLLGWSAAEVVAGLDWPA